jgi:putative oxidoreductase
MVGGWTPDIHGERTMMRSDYSRGDYAMLAVSLALAAVFIYAGVDKLRDPLQFADNIAGFAILPVALINLLALSLPLFEIAAGLALLWSTSRRVGALAISILSVVFFIALSSALLRGLTLDCGCFGVGAPSRQRMWLELALDAVLFAGAVWVHLRSIGSEPRRPVATSAIKA